MICYSYMQGKKQSCQYNFLRILTIHLLCFSLLPQVSLATERNLKLYMFLKNESTKRKNLLEVMRSLWNFFLLIFKKNRRLSHWKRKCSMKYVPWVVYPCPWAIFNKAYKQWVALVFEGLDFRTRRKEEFCDFWLLRILCVWRGANWKVARLLGTEME